MFFPVLLGVVVSQPAFVGLLAVAAGLGGYLLVKGDSRVEARRQEAIKLSQIANENGFTLANEILSSYAVGNYSGAFSGLRHLYTVLTDDTQRKAAFEAMLKIQLDKRLSDPTTKADLLKILEAKGLKLVEA